MILVLGGFLGSGRKSLARRLERERGFYFYKMGDFKPYEFARRNNGSYVERPVNPRSDEERLFLCRRALEQFPLVAKMHEHVVIERTLHRAEPRQYLLDALAKIGTEVRFIWVESSEEFASEHIRTMVRRGELKSVDAGFASRKKAQEEFQSFDGDVVRFRNEGPPDEAFARLWTLIQSMPTRSLFGT